MIEYIYISIFAFVFTNILIQEGEIFGFYKPMLAALFGFSELLEGKDVEIEYWKWFIWKITTCQNCMAGQISLWYSVYLLITTGGNLFYYILMITLSIAGAHFMMMINNYLKTSDTCSN